ncbi:MAG: hypothetical protein V4772_05015 [Pseudomonadota bacterium]
MNQIVGLTKNWQLRGGAGVLFALVLLFFFNVHAQTAAVSRPAWTIESMSARDPAPIILTGNTAEELAGHGFGPGQVAHARWHAVYWERETPSLVPVDKIRLEKVPFDWAAPHNKSMRAFPDVPGTPLMLIRLQWKTEAVPGTTPTRPTGTFRSRQIDGMVVNELLREGLNKPFGLLGKTWTLKTQVVKSVQGRLLPGSVELQVIGVDGKPAVVLGRAPGHIFKEQRLLWTGDMNGDGAPDFYIRRVLVTGHIDHIISLSTGGLRYVIAGITVDPDHPESLFTSGVGEIEDREDVFANSPSPYPEVILAATDKAEKSTTVPARYALSGAMPLKRYGLITQQMLKPFSNAIESSQEVSGSVAGVSQPAPISLPLSRVLKDMRFDFGDESYRMLVESVETYAGEDTGYQSSIGFGEYEGRGVALQISVYHRGQRQVLLVTHPYMEGGMSFSAGDLDGSGKLSLNIDYNPHYNNGMTYTWRRSEKPDQLFKRTVVYQSQGC